jgi:hypothetical protein
MSRQWQTCIVLLACGVALLVSSASSKKQIDIVSPTQAPAQTQPPQNTRNLSLQPEAFKMSRRLGKRFRWSRPTFSTLAGTLTVGTSRQTITVSRRQTSRGENVDIVLAGEVGILSWNDVDGAKAAGSTPGGTERILIERFVLDSPDEFVLAQLRGASYYTTGRNVRADVGGDDNYTGPLWDVVRVTEPETDGARRSLSSSRLYYLNVQTGLIDKIVSELNGETIEANVLQWLDQAGEKHPSHIVWKRGNETVQEFRLTTVAIQAEQ